MCHGGCQPHVCQCWGWGWAVIECLHQLVEISSCPCSKKQQDTEVLECYQIFSTEITILVSH